MLCEGFVSQARDDIMSQTYIEPVYNYIDESMGNVQKTHDTKSWPKYH